LMTQVATDAELEKYAEQAKQNETAEQILQAGQQAGDQMKAVLTSAPKATEVASAHKAIAVFDGVQGEGEGLAAFKLENATAKFKIVRYLRYAHLIPAIACGLVKEFSIPVGGGADEQTALLAFSTSGGALSEVVASLTEGDRVELEWLQIKIEMDTDIEEHKFGMVEQCQKLLKLDAATEEALVKQYPQPELLLPKVAPKAKGEEKAALEAKFGKKKKRKGKKGRA
jgi:hypothetical protein